MNIQQYMKDTQRTCADLGDDLLNQMHMVIGISTEAGELLDAYKKILVYKKVADLVNIEEEIFDIMWYIVNLCRMLGIDPEKGMDKNIGKLMVRYPEKFSEDMAISRDLDAERKILES